MQRNALILVVVWLFALPVEGVVAAVNTFGHVQVDGSFTNAARLALLALGGLVVLRPHRPRNLSHARTSSADAALLFEIGGHAI